jgi:hypothetical protein
LTGQRAIVLLGGEKTVRGRGQHFLAILLFVSLQNRIEL